LRQSHHSYVAERFLNWFHMDLRATRRDWNGLNFWKSKRVTGKPHRIAIAMFDYDRKERTSWGLTLTQPSTT